VSVSVCDKANIVVEASKPGALELQRLVHTSQVAIRSRHSMRDEKHWYQMISIVIAKSWV